MTRLGSSQRAAELANIVLQRTLAAKYDSVGPKGGEQVAHPMQANPDLAEGAFEFLITRGFTLEERWVTGGESFKDGWRLSYSSPAVRVIVQYLDAQFEIHFERAGRHRQLSCY